VSGERRWSCFRPIDRRPVKGGGMQWTARPGGLRMEGPELKPWGDIFPFSIH
jgi:hypothetical protein